MHTHSPIPVPPWSPAARRASAWPSPGAFGNRVIGSPWWPVIPSARNALPPGLGGVPWMAADLSRREAVEAVAAWVGDTFQGLDVLVNNAGFTRKIAATTPLAEAEREWDALLDGNLKARSSCRWRCCRISRKRAGGSSISDRSLRRPVAAVLVRWAMRQPRPACMASAWPGAGTRFARDHGEQRGAGLHRRHPVLSGGLDPQRVAAIVGETPLGRTGRVEDIAAAVAWLASPGAGFVTGTVVSVNGGWRVGN